LLLNINENYHNKIYKRDFVHSFQQMLGPYFLTCVQADSHSIHKIVPRASLVSWPLDSCQCMYRGKLFLFIRDPFL
jgi:hypothetical protein